MPYWLIAVREPGLGHDRCSTGEGIASSCPTCLTSHYHYEEL